MKSNKKIIFIVILNILIIGGICSFININKNLTKEKQVIKEMSESAQVSNLQTQINTLNKEHTDYANYIQTSKRKIASAITEMGVETSENADADTMVNNIKSISSNHIGNSPYISKFTQNFYTHQDWGGTYRPTYNLTIIPNGANTITLGIEQSSSGTYSSYGTPSISSITNGTYSDLAITPINNESEITITISFDASDQVRYSGAEFVKSIYIKSFS